MNCESKKSVWWAVCSVGLLIAAISFCLLVQPVPDSHNPGGGGFDSNQHVDDASDAQDGDTLPLVLDDAANPGVAKFGYDPQPQATMAFVATLDKPTLQDANPRLLQDAAKADEDVLLYRSLYKAHRQYSGGDEWIVGKQGIGDCVSWGWAHGADIHLAVMWELGDTSIWKPAATESIYGGSRVEARNRTRGGYSDGSYGGAAAEWVSKKGGIVFREKYPDVDLTTYSAKRAKDWGNYGNGGENDDGKLDEIARKHPVKNVALVRSFDEAAAAIASGYPVPVCSSQGFSSRRDKDGFSAASGTWMHCMCFIGVRYGDRPGLLCLNSWGPNWVSGPKYPEDMPEGSFWVDKRVADRMLSGGDSFAVSGYVGFPYRDLNHGDWVQVAPPFKREAMDRDAVVYAVSPQFVSRDMRIEVDGL